MRKDGGSFCYSCPSFFFSCYMKLSFLKYNLHRRLSLILRHKLQSFDSRIGPLGSARDNRQMPVVSWRVFPFLSSLIDGWRVSCHSDNLPFFFPDTFFPNDFVKFRQKLLETLISEWWSRKYFYDALAITDYWLLAREGGGRRGRGGGTCRLILASPGYFFSTGLAFF